MIRHLPNRNNGHRSDQFQYVQSTVKPAPISFVKTQSKQYDRLFLQNLDSYRVLYWVAPASTYVYCYTHTHIAGCVLSHTWQRRESIPCLVIIIFTFYWTTRLGLNMASSVVQVKYCKLFFSWLRFHLSLISIITLHAVWPSEFLLQFCFDRLLHLVMLTLL